MKRIICCLMAIFITLGTAVSFVGCNDSKEDKDAQDKNRVTVIQGGVSNYVIVYPAICSEAEDEAVNIIREKILEITEVRLKTESEEFLKPKDGENYIYVGNTTFEPALAAKEEISKEYFDAYEADVVGNNIYFVGASNEALVNAAKYFAEQLVEKNYDKESKTLYFEGFRFDGETVAQTGFLTKKMREYSIVYASDWLNIKSMAKSLQEAIAKETGITVSIYSDKEIPEGKYEILVGETNRGLSSHSYDKTSRMMEYVYVVEQCKIQLAFGGCYSGEKCIEDFTRMILRSNSDVLTAGEYFPKEFAPESQALTGGSDVRIMSANVLAYRWGEAKYRNVLPVAQRAEIFAGVLLNYTPDAVGAQEMDEPWKQAFPWYLERMAKKDSVEYTYLHSSATYENKTMINFSSILYRSDMYTVEETGCRVYSIWEKTPTYFQRVASYVKLTAKNDSSKEFILVNTHWAHEDHETVNACAVEMAALVNELKAKYEGVSVFCTGDYNNLNTREWGDKYLNQFVSDIGGSIASAEAKKSGVLITPGGCRYSAEKMNDNVLREIDNSFIDHIVCAGGASTVMRHDTIRANGCHVLSDHSPIYADIDLK